MSSPPVQRALISVSDKSGLQELAAGLVAAGVEIYSTGGTRRHLEQAGIAVQDVAAYTGFPEMMDGRVKTLHPRVFAGVLCRHDNPGDMQALREHEIASFELLVVNLYPFRETISRQGVTPAEAIEQIDIGGPSLVRAAAKNHAFVTIATSPKQYPDVLAQVQAEGATTLNLRRQLAGAAFAHTAEYDTLIADYFAGQSEEPLPPSLRVSLERTAELRYGENPHQAAALYSTADREGANLIDARQLSGKELSYNNLLDLDAALAMVRALPQPAVVVLKHNNPCGAATDANLATALKNALDGDPLSAFGGILGFNREVDAACAEVLAEPGLFIEAIVAPSFAREAFEILTTKPKWKSNVRLLETGALRPAAANRVLRAIEGGFLVQDADVSEDPRADWNVVTETQPSDAQRAELEFAWAMVRHVKSNAIVLSRDNALVGVGAGQMSRVDSVNISVEKAGERSQGSVLASDAFFPFPDSIHSAAAAGVRAIIQPGGSRKDDEVIAACNEHGLPMIFTGRRHFKH